MKTQSIVIVVFLAVLSCYGSLAAIGSYDYCGKPCNDPSGIVCAYNQNCYTYFINRCDMKKKNCDNNDRFNEAQFISCQLGRKCR